RVVYGKALLQRTPSTAESIPPLSPSTNPRPRAVSTRSLIHPARVSASFSSSTLRSLLPLNINSILAVEFNRQKRGFYARRRYYSEKCQRYYHGQETAPRRAGSHRGCHYHGRRGRERP